MNSIWIITKRELASFFDSLIAYILIVLFLGVSGFFTWLSGGDVFFSNQANLQPFFGIAYWLLIIFVPAITMRTIAEENRSGTLELLSTKAVSDWEIVVGKFLSCLLLMMITLAFTIPYYITISALGDVDHGGIIGGYFGLILMSAAYISMGVFASSVTNNQIVAFLIAFFLGLFFQILFDIISSSFRGAVGNTLHFLSFRSHYESLTRGVVDLRDLLYFGSIIVAGLLFSTTMLTKRNWKA
ncbi:ABC transporter permease subunit [Fulvivirgaceae bacterium BMA10]|uniref:ABC transporter permease subunit n=1 Tax=Splendidivirga corallicola TaxID=3051826 RepID=A0ABT8KSR7_9BACT|nr:ABC transporter permease subunit [Fulvivirgaceae bacterium BMA10]